MKLWKIFALIAYLALLILIMEAGFRAEDGAEMVRGFTH